MQANSKHLKLFYFHFHFECGKCGLEGKKIQNLNTLRKKELFR